MRFSTLAVLLATSWMAPSYAAVGCDGNPTALIYTATNEFTGNVLIALAQCESGDMVELGRYPTGGLGSGPHPLAPFTALGSQDSLIVTENQDYVLVTNAGDNTLSVFAIMGQSLAMTDIVPSGGEFPNSVTQCGDYVYVENAGLDGSIVGFTLEKNGTLTMIPDSTRSLEAINVGPVPLNFLSPGQVAFTKECDQLVVMVKDGADASPDGPPFGLPRMPGRFFVFAVEDGVPAEKAVISEMDYITPFSVVLNERNDGSRFIYTTDTFELSSSSFELFQNGTAVRLQDPVSNGNQTAICWNVHNGRYMYATNAGAGSITSYAIGEDGLLSVQDLVAYVQSVDSVFLDMAILPDQGMVYALAAGLGEVVALSIGNDGSLTLVGSVGGLPAGSGDAPEEFGVPGAAPSGLAAVSMLRKFGVSREEQERIEDMQPPTSMGMMRAMGANSMVMIMSMMLLMIL